MDMDLKTRIEVLPCGMCEEMMECDTCLYSKEAHDLYYQIRAEVIYEIKKILPPIYCNNCSQIACDGGRVGSIQECASVRLLIDVLGELEEQLKEI